MKTNSKLAIMLVLASMAGSATTLMATTALDGVNTNLDKFIPSKNTTAEENFVQVSTRMPDASTDFTVVAEKTVNSVVSIKSFETPRQQMYGGGDWDPFEFFFGPGFGGSQRRQQPQKKEDSKPQAKGSGSGVIISEDGYIVTNNHVIDGAEKLEVTLNDNSKYNATVVGTDPNTDIALIKISAKGLQPVVFGNSDNIKLGQWVLAVGNPFGLNSTVTAGIISAKARGMAESNAGIKAFIQHDAAVNPGNSGGALVNTAGELVGINTMIVSQTGNYSGCSFAVPSNTVKKIVTDIKQYGTVQRAVLGIQYQELDADLAEEHKVTATKDGIYVAKVNDLSAAKEAGLQEGDVIVKINEASVKNSGELQEQMNKLRPGDKIQVSYYRDNKLKTTTVTLKNNQGSTKITKSSDMLTLGCAFAELTDQEKKDLSISKGLKVVGVKAGKFKRAGVKDGFVITDINNAPVSTREDVENIYNQIMRSSDSDKVMFITGLYPTGKKVYYAVDLSDIDDE
ncbi:Do family serine endopeptidase [Sodaliphilus sp.]|uniref:Do family serine endopeptidase n=1 Tax=Sodaliphilus sp. TaxID=2815818 RepID=UPI00388E4AB3